MKGINPILGSILTVAFLFVSCEKEESPLGSQGILGYKISNSDINRECTSLFFQSQTVGYATTQDGEVFKTADGGRKWNKLDILSPVPLRTSCFINENVGYVFGGNSECSPLPCEPFGSIAYKTTNGGQTWQRLNIPYEKSELYSAFFFDENNGFAVGFGLCIKTSDGGETWQPVTIEENNLSKISFLSRNVGYALDLTGGFYKTEDGGQSWKEISINGKKRAYNFYFVNETTGYANQGNRLFKTTDGGEYWELIDFLEDSVNYIYFANEKSGITISLKSYNSYGNYYYNNYYNYYNNFPRRYVVKFTNDGGQTWITKELGEEELNHQCLFAKDNIVYSLINNKIINLIFKQ